MSKGVPFDPFQVFEVTHEHCAKVIVKVVCGRKITKGWAKDLLDIPDPYVILTLGNAPNSWRKTSVKDNDINPIWNESFVFYLHPGQEHILEMSLMDANYMVDEHLATRSLPLSTLPLDRKIRETIQFNETSEVDIEVSAEICEKADLRFSLTLCQEEKNFVEVRKRKIQKAMKAHFGLAAPRNYQEVPVIAVIGSGGGFRAMTAYSGAFSALAELGVLDMATYVGGLSGSAWYLSQLYSHQQWPRDITPGEQREQLKYNIDHSFLWLFKTHSLAFAKEVWKKRSRGEPVSFTDLFGHLVGNTIVQDRLDAKLSDQRHTVEDGQCPLPLYTCLHVKKSVSAMVFHEWMEFSPFEVGLPKYGTFMKSHQFACKFFMGTIIKHFPEPPLHFLQGIWGSAFCIQFKRLFQDDKKVDSVELMRREREELQEELTKDMAKYDAADSESSEDESGKVNEKGTHGEKTTGGLQRKRSKSTKLKQKSFWDGVLARMMESSWFQTIELRAAQVFNFMRGLSLNNVFPFSPFTKTQEEEEDENNKCTFGSIFDLHPTHVKKLYVVDSGLTFNSPFPVVLRPQREVDIILSFDFSARPTDDTPPFKELLLAAKWAELNKVPFPPIDPNIVEKQGLRECYVFKHPWDPNCPIVLHFCLININFRQEIRPGIPRTTQEDLDFGQFSIFDDPAHPYSTFKFTYTHLEFERLSKLIEYNTLLYRDTIFQYISTCIKRRKRFSIRRPCKKNDIARLSLNSRAKVAELEKYIAMVENVTDASKLDSGDVSLDSPTPIVGQSPSSKHTLTPLDASNGDRSLCATTSVPYEESDTYAYLHSRGAKGRRKSKEEADVDTLKSKTPRPISSPVRFLGEKEAETSVTSESLGVINHKRSNDRVHAQDEDDPIVNTRLQRGNVSLRADRARSRLSSAMSRVDEEGEEELDTLPDELLTDKTPPSKGTLTRSRPVDALKRPNTLTRSDKRTIDEIDPVQINVHTSNGENDNEDVQSPQNINTSATNGVNNNGLKPHHSPIDLNSLSPRLARRANALSPEQRKSNGHASLEKSLSNEDSNELLTPVSSLPVRNEGNGLEASQGQNQDSLLISRSKSPAKIVEELLDSDKRETFS